MRAETAKALNLPFDEAIKYFTGKVKLPTATWKDLWHGMHSRAFVAAGAMKADLLTDMHQAVDKAIKEGTTLEEFRKDFDNIVAKHGWDYKGGRNWRSAVIFNTNLSVAYSAGQYAQMTDEAVLKARPYWRYLASSSAEKRPEHKAWYNVVLPWDNPWWETHDPPNGWGCKCGKASMSERELARMIEEEKNGPNPIKTKAPDDGTYEWMDKATGEIHTMPNGIDPGWAYSPGQTRWGKRLADDVFQEWEALKGKAWETITPGNWETAGRPKLIDLDSPSTKPWPRVNTVDEAAESIAKAIGGVERRFTLTASNGFRHELFVDAQNLAEHVDLERSAYFPYIPEVLENPFEVWAAFERHKGTGKYQLTVRFVKAIALEKNKSLLMVMRAKGGFLQGWTFIPSDRLSWINKKRIGELLYAR